MGGSLPATREKRTSAGCFVVRKNGKDEYELLVTFSEWPNKPSAWVLPKGGIKDGESFKQAAVRETGEETGYYELEVIKTLKVERYITKHDKDKTVHWFLAKLLSNKTRPTQHTPTEAEAIKEVTWKTFSEAKDVLKEFAVIELERVEGYLAKGLSI